MTDDLADRYAELRRAVTALLEAMAAEQVSPAHLKRLDALERALHGHEPDDVVAREVVDPDRHLLNMYDYKTGVPNGAPYPLGDEARSLRDSMALDDATDHPVGEWPYNWNPTLTGPQVTVVASLLQELAARLTATGDPGGQDLAAVTLTLADEVLTPTAEGER